MNHAIELLTKEQARVKNRLNHAKKRVKDTKKRHAQLSSNNATLTVHAGWDLGYWEGKCTTLENQLDELGDMKDEIEKESE